MQRAARFAWQSAWHRPAWIMRGLIAVLAPLPVLAWMYNVPPAWWVQSGFESFPGTFVRVGTGNYPICRPWREKLPGRHREPGVNVTSRLGTFYGVEEHNFAVLLPVTAQVTAIYCGAALGTLPLSECSVLRCGADAHAQVEDLVYTRGRGITFSVRNKTAKPDQRTNLGFWVYWKEGANAAP